MRWTGYDLTGTRMEGLSAVGKNERHLLYTIEEIAAGRCTGRAAWLAARSAVHVAVTRSEPVEDTSDPYYVEQLVRFLSQIGPPALTGRSVVVSARLVEAAWHEALAGRINYSPWESIVLRRVVDLVDYGVAE